MNNPRINRAIYFICCASVVVVYFVGVIGVTGLSPLDDHLFISTLFQGKDFGYYVIPELGRFFPLTAQEYALVSKFVNPTPTLLYTINALKLLACGGLLAYCLNLSRLSNVGCGIIWGLVIFSSGMANTLYRLSAGELNAFLLLLILVWSCMLMSEKKEYKYFNERMVIALGVMALVLAMLYKELIFVFGLIFGVYETLRYYRARQHIPLIIILILSVSVLYITGYAVWRFYYTSGSYIVLRSTAIWDVLTFYVDNDPFIIFIVFPLTAYRTFLILREAKNHTVYDSFLMASIGYAGAFLVLKICTTYYLLPAYGFAACGMAGVLAQTSSIRIFKITLAGIFVCGINTVSFVLSDIISQKAIINNHYQFVSFISNWLQQEYKTSKKINNLVLSGVSAGNSIEIVKSMETFLISLGVPKNIFDVKASEPTSNLAISSFYKEINVDGYVPKTGDLIVYNPYQEMVTLPPLLSPSLREIYRSSSEWSPPRWSGWQWVRYCLINHTRCKLKVWQNRRYTGYVAMVLTRNPVALNLVPLESPSYRIGSLLLPKRMRAGETKMLDILIENTGFEIWPASGVIRPGKFVNLAYRWFNDEGELVLEGDRAPLPESMRPNDLAKISIFLKCPASPGKYKLVIGPVQEGVRWFPYGADKVNSIDVF